MRRSGRWVYALLEALFFIVLGGFASLVGFLLGYLRRGPVFTALVGVALGVLSVVIALTSNPLGFFFGFVFGGGVSQYFVSVALTVAFTLAGWWLGRSFKGAHR